MIKLFLKQLLRKAPFTSIDIKLPKEFHGSVYGGWTIVKDSLSTDSIIYSFGIGEDISFDLSLIERYHCNIYGFDPTPAVQLFVKSQKAENFHFYPVGISTVTGKVKFYLPSDPNNISHSAQVKETDQSQAFIEVDVDSLENIMKKNNHNHIDLLKMDVEGFEYDVLKQLLEKNLTIKQLLVEFHHGIYGYSNEQTKLAIDLLKEKGFRLFNISSTGREYSFLKV